MHARMRGFSRKMFLVFAFVVVLYSGVPQYARAAALSATQSPIAAVSAGPPGTGWSSSTLADAILVDGAEAKLTSAMPLESASQLLVLTGFNFDIPADATITGVAVSVTRRSTSSSDEFVQDSAVELVGVFGTSTSLSTAAAWPATLAAAVYGDSSTLWGVSLSPADVNSASFGLALAVQNTDPVSAHNARVDGATITVYYTVLAAQVITVGTSSPASAAYGLVFDVAASADSGLPVAIAASGACSGTGSDSATITMASSTGDCTVSYSQAGNAEYAAAADVVEVAAAQKAPLRLAVASTTKRYGEEVIFDGAFSFDGGTSLYGPDTVTGITKTSAGAATSSSVAGSPYSIVPSDAVGTGLDNYDITYVSDSLTVLPAPLSITADAKSKTFGDPDPALTYAHSALVGGDTEAIFSGLLTRAVGEDVGAYAIGEGTLSAGANYEVSFTRAELVIQAAPPPEPPQQEGNIGTGTNGAPVGSYGMVNAVVPIAPATSAGDGSTQSINVGRPAADVVVPVEGESQTGTEGSAFNIEQPRQRDAATAPPPTQIKALTKEATVDIKQSPMVASAGSSNIGTGIFRAVLDFFKFLGKVLFGL